MKRVCYTIRFMLADSSEVRNSMFSSRVFFIVVGKGKSVDQVDKRLKLLVNPNRCS